MRMRSIVGIGFGILVIGGLGLVLWPGPVRRCVSGDCQDGSGVVKYRDGSKYVGGFASGKFHGAGVHTWPDGSRISAQWKAGKIDGVGKLDLESVSGCIGVYEAGEIINGCGRYVYDDGSVYLGDWSTGMRSGTGTLWDSGGRVVYRGAWRAGEPVRE